uniref:Macaca fascicularis brain cDNA clone: QflA-21477, similar to human hypothetical protein FLJ37306 (FLJ37306), mRNA, RefSeq: NM_182765.1 n=1 Tax=Macaca fascicularis TaxID=9541 RepID=I7GNK2_MACFA|nr:unnamed protein product [Macaca fascicularis]
MLPAPNQQNSSRVEELISLFSNSSESNPQIFEKKGLLCLLFSLRWK